MLFALLISILYLECLLFLYIMTGVPILIVHFIFWKWIKSYFMLFITGACVIIYLLFNDTFFLNKGGFISRVYNRSFFEGYAVQSVMVFSIGFFLIIRFEIIMEDYFIYMNSHPTGDAFTSAISNSAGNSATSSAPPNLPNPSNPPGSSALNITDSSVRNPIINLCYTQGNCGGDFLRVSNDQNGDILRAMKRDGLHWCDVKATPSARVDNSQYLLDLENCAIKIRTERANHAGISIPNTLPADKDFLNYKKQIVDENGRIFVRMSNRERAALDLPRFLNN